MTGQLLTFTQVAEYLNVPVKTLRYWRHLGKAPAFIKPGRQLLCHPDELARWVKAEQRKAS